jgi:hypothetical protein
MNRLFVALAAAAVLVACSGGVEPPSSEATIGVSSEALAAPYTGTFSFSARPSRVPLGLLRAPVQSFDVTTVGATLVEDVTLTFQPGQGTAVVHEAARLEAAGLPFQRISLAVPSSPTPIVWVDAWVVRTTSTAREETLTFTTVKPAPRQCMPGDVLCVPPPS